MVVNESSDSGENELDLETASARHDHGDQLLSCVRRFNLLMKALEYLGISMCTVSEFDGAVIERRVVDTPALQCIRRPPASPFWLVQPKDRYPCPLLPSVEV